MRLHACPNAFARLVKRVYTLGRTRFERKRNALRYTLHLGGTVPDFFVTLKYEIKLTTEQ